MAIHLKHSRITKALTDAEGIGFEDAEERFGQVRLAVVANDCSLTSAAGQAALLTALAAGAKIFNHVVFVLPFDVALRRPIAGTTTLASAARMLGAVVAPETPTTTSHLIVMGPHEAASPFIVRCWWDRWRAGIRPGWDSTPTGEAWNPLAGTFSAAIALREVFANVLGRRSYPRSTTVSLWEPWAGDDCVAGPEWIFVPRRIWIVGLGHLGQGYLWNLGMLPAHGESLVLQDYQFAGVENEATGLLTRASHIGQRKTRVAAQWIEVLGWKTELIERKFTKMTITDDDPPLVIGGLDKPAPRLDVLNASFRYMIDCGVGHGPTDFEACQIRVLPKGASSTWNHPASPSRTSSLLETEPYRVLAVKDQCGAFQLADASVAVPFVGAAVGALAVSQSLRVAAMETTSPLLQFELSAPNLTSAAPLGQVPSANIGAIQLNLDSGRFATT